MLTPEQPINVVVGSSKDLDFIKNTLDVLRDFKIGYDIEIISAHRTPKRVMEFAENARMKGTRVIIAASSGAAHLAGAIAAHTILPVIGVPVPARHLDGMDSLLSTVQMPTGVPVATVGIGESGAKNAAILAMEMIALTDRNLGKKLEGFRKMLEDKIIRDNKELTK